MSVLMSAISSFGMCSRQKKMQNGGNEGCVTQPLFYPASMLTPSLGFGGVAVIHLDGPCTIVKLRNQTEVDNTWVDCTDLEEAEMRVLGRLADLRACEDFRNS